MAEVMEFDKKLSTRGGTYRINPLQVYVDFAENERRASNYGTGEEWEEHKNSIKEHGVLEPIRVFWDTEKSQYHLSHGYRRMKAVLELIAEGTEIQDIPCIVVSQNDENTVLQHLVLNTGRPLTDYEKSSVITKLRKYGWEVKDIHKKTGMSEQKIYTLIKFQENASKQLKDEVSEGKIAFNSAVEIARKTKGNVEKQVEIVDTAKKKAEETGAKKVTGSVVKEVTNGNGDKTKEISKPTTKGIKEPEKPLSQIRGAKKTDKEKLTELETFLTKKKDVDADKFELLESIIDFVDNNTSIEDLYKNHFKKSGKK